MRKPILLAVAALLLAITQPARAQFCPGVSPWVFDDVAASDPFCGYITWMAENGITLGCQTIDANHRLYCPSATVTRAAMAAFMNRLGNIRVEAVDTGPGLTGGPITSVGTIGLAATQLLPTTACANNQIPRWNGTAWACGNDANSGGTVTSVASGTGLTGGPVTSSGTLSIAAGYQLPQGCSNGQVPKSNGSGGWTCAADASGSGTVTSVATGTGLSGGPITGSGTISADTTYLQRRVSAACTAGSSIRAIAQDGTVTCQPPANPTEIYLPAGGTSLANGAALAAAIAAITDAATKGYVIRLSRGTYELTSPLLLKDGIALTGTGIAQTTLLANGLASVISTETGGANEIRDLTVHAVSSASVIGIRAEFSSVKLVDTNVVVDCLGPGPVSVAGVGVDDVALGADVVTMLRSSVAVTNCSGSAIGVSAVEMTLRDSSVVVSGAASFGIGLNVAVQASIRDSKVEVGTTGTMMQQASGMMTSWVTTYEVGTVEIVGSTLLARSVSDAYAIQVGPLALDGSFFVANSRIRANPGAYSIRRVGGASFVPIAVVQSQWEGAAPGSGPLNCVANYNWSFAPTSIC